MEKNTQWGQQLIMFSKTAFFINKDIRLTIQNGFERRGGEWWTPHKGMGPGD